jgi:hypothetical protein
MDEASNFPMGMQVFHLVWCSPFYLLRSVMSG